jgi:hypothetical protein
VRDGAAKVVANLAGKTNWEEVSFSRAYAEM